MAHGNSQPKEIPDLAYHLPKQGKISLQLAHALQHRHLQSSCGVPFHAFAAYAQSLRVLIALKTSLDLVNLDQAVTVTGEVFHARQHTDMKSWSRLNVSGGIS